jgi:hypothetical protein
MVLRLTSYSPRRSGFFVTVIPEKLASQELDASVEASGPYDLAVRIRALFVKSANASTASRTNVRDDRETPLCVGGTAGVLR